MWITFSKCHKMTSEERRSRRFSEDFRKEQVKLIEQGDRTIAQVSRLYEVKADNVRKWVKKYGTTEFPEVYVIQTQDEAKRIQYLETQVSRLNEVIGQMHIEMLYKNELLALAREVLGDEFEKKIKS
jgi:transposase